MALHGKIAKPSQPTANQIPMMRRISVRVLPAGLAAA
jgi:hypothetical protein